MPKDRKLVPAALRSELDEYASLIRSLRTNDALDITSQLTRYSSSKSVSSPAKIAQHGEDTVQTLEGEPTIGTQPENTSNSLKDVAGPATGARSSRKRKRPVEKPIRQSNAQRRDLWTRWPLLAGDVLPPEWDLNDEINSLIMHILKNRPPPFTPAPSHSNDAPESSGSTTNRDTGSNAPIQQSSDDDNIDVEVDMHPLVPHLTATSTHFLSVILSLLASHTPNRPASLQNRIEPIGWENVLDVLSTYPDQNFIDENILQKVTARLERVYPPSDPANKSKASERASKSHASRQKLSTALAAADSSLFEPPIQKDSDDESPNEQVTKRSRKLRRAAKTRANSLFRLYTQRP